MGRVSSQPIEAQELTRIIDRISFLYVDKCRVSRDRNAITFTTEHHVVQVPAATVACLLLGPGTSITHAGVAAAAENATTVVWSGSEGARFYAHGCALAKTSRWIERQAELVTGQRTRLGVARAMYEQRFPGESTEHLTMQQLRGKEGARVREVYRTLSQQYNVEWHGRNYNPDDFEESDPLNQALSTANAALYGVVQSVITGLGLSPALGFVHSGNYRSFTFDIADLYKAETSIPVAFRAVAEGGQKNLARRVRGEMRIAMYEHKTIARTLRDLRTLLSMDGDGDDEELGDVVYLWDEKLQRVSGGTAYGDRS